MLRQLSPWAVVVACAMTTGLGAEENKRAEKLPLDRNFLIKSFTCSHADVMFAELADKRAGSDKVKKFARKIAKDHTSMKEDMARIIKDRKLGVLAGTEKKTKDEIKRLGKLEGSEFDRAYLKRVITDHKKAVRMFENQQTKGEDKELTSFAKKMLPGIRAHLREARKLQASLGDK
jgi:putative membrane protein